MAFPVNSTSVYDKELERSVKAMQRRPRASSYITAAGVFNCKITAGTTLYSAHAFGKAVDYMASEADLGFIAMRVVEDATKSTFANLGKPTKISFVIYQDRQWTPLTGWTHYDGVYHGNHVHAATMGSTSVKPPCAS